MQPAGKPDYVSRAFLGCFVVPSLACLALGFCLLLPPAVFRLRYGRGPLAADGLRVHSGMTPDEVIDVNGPPHKVYADRDDWIYFDDPWELNYCGVHFGQDGLVKWSWVH